MIDKYLLTYFTPVGNSQIPDGTVHTTKQKNKNCN